MSEYSAEIELEIVFDPHKAPPISSYSRDLGEFYEGAVYLTVEVTGTVSRYYPARFSGAPDSWAPEEGGEVEVTGLACTHNGDALDYDAITWLMSKQDWSDAEQALFEAAQDCDGDDDGAREGRGRDEF